MDSAFRLPGYTVTRTIKETGDEQILLVYQQALNKRCFIRANRSLHGIAQLKNEVDILERCQHRNTLQLIDHGFQGDWYYVATEYVSQGNLTDLLQAGLPIRGLLRIIKDVAMGLGHLHECGFAHNNLCIENILVRTDGSAVLADYRWSSPLQQPHADPGALSEINLNSGTASPEILQRHVTSPSSDFFALGVVLYQSIVGEQPFVGTTTNELLEQITQRPLPTLPQQFLEFRPLLEVLLAASPHKREAAPALLNELVETVRSQSHHHPVTLRNEDVSAQELRSLGGNLLTTDSDGRPSKRTLRRKKRQRRTAVAAISILSASLLVGAAYLIQPARFISVDAIAASLGLAEDPELVAAWADARSLREDPNQGLAAIVAAYQRVLALDPNYRPADEALGTLLSEWKQSISGALINDNIELAATRLDEAMALLPTDPEINLLSLQLQNRYRAERLLKSTEALLTSHGLSDLPSAEAAIQSYQEILRLTPNHSGALRGLERLALHYVDLSKQAAIDGDVGQAIRYLERATAANETLRSLDDARRLISEATTAQAAIDELLLQGERLQQVGQRLEPKGENSAERYQQVLATDPDNVRAIRAMSELAGWVQQEGERLLRLGKLREIETLVLSASQRGISTEVVSELRGALENEVERRDTINDLLKESNELVVKGLLTEPANRNAVMLLRRVQQLDPGNEYAAEMLEQCARRLAAAAIEAHEFGLLADADQYLALALTIRPGNSDWVELLEQWQSG